MACAPGGSVRFSRAPYDDCGSDPDAILAGHVVPGMMVLEPGPGMGFFTLALAERVGVGGMVIAVDQQLQMIAGLERRARKAGLAQRIDARVCEPGTMGLEDLEGRIDLTFAFAVVHEMPDAPRFFREAAAASRPASRLLLAEPAGHVGEALFETELAAAREAGFAPVARPRIRGCQTALLVLDAAA